MKYFEKLKKWLGCIVSFLVGVCGLTVLFLSGLKTDLFAFNSVSKNYLKAYEILKVRDMPQQTPSYLIESYKILFVIAIIAIVVYALLILWSIVLLLKNVNIIKKNSKAFNIVNSVLLGIVLIVLVGLILTTLNYAKNYDILIETSYAFINVKAHTTIGAYQWVMCIFALIANLTNITFGLTKLKSTSTK